MRGKRGIWTVSVILLVAVTMGMLTWPMLAARRKNKEHRTWLALNKIESLRRRFELDRRRPLADLRELGLLPEDLRDGWSRPIQFRRSGEKDPKGCILWSLGHNPDDPSDDLILAGSPVP